MDPPSSRRVSVPCGTLRIPPPALVAYGTLTLSRAASHPLRLAQSSCCMTGLRPLSLATTRGMFSFPRPTEMFQFGRFPPLTRSCEFITWGFPIRTWTGLAPAHGFPSLFAVYHVLHRHLTPRHPPCALPSFALGWRADACRRNTELGQTPSPDGVSGFLPLRFTP